MLSLCYSSLLTTVRTFLQHGFLYGLQALRCNICSSVAHLQATAPWGVPALAWLIHRDILALAWFTSGLQFPQRHMPLPWSTSFYKCISSSSPRCPNLPAPGFHVSSTHFFLFLQMHLQVSLHLLTSFLGSLSPAPSRYCPFLNILEQLCVLLWLEETTACRELFSFISDWNCSCLRAVQSFLPHGAPCRHHYWNPAIYTKYIASFIPPWNRWFKNILNIYPF